MRVLRIAAIFLCTGLVPVRAEVNSSQMNIGLDPSLAAGEYALRSGRYEEGVALTLEGLRSVKTSRERAAAYNNLCAGYVGTGQFVTALEACDKALAAGGRNWRIFNNRALALLYSGRIEAARIDLEKGLELNPDSTTLAKVAAMIDAQSGEQVIASIPPGEKK